jgi:drug/metabolite transporter (DMT)-like permease
MILDRLLFGMLLMIGFCALAPMGDAIAKLLGNSIPMGQLLLVRFGMQAILLLPVVWMSGTKFAMTRRIFVLMATRTILHIIGIGTLFTAFRYLPLADAVAIAFVMPFMLLVLGRMILKEEVGPRRVTACAIGFLGTLLVIQPSFTNVGAPALLPLVAALAFAFFMLVTRSIAKEIDPVALQGISGILATGMIAGVYLVSTVKSLPGVEMVVPDIGDGILLFSIGVIGTLAHLLMVWSLRFAPAATLAPMQYLEIPVATLLGWLIFNDLPNALASTGIAITVAAGLYIVLRERASVQMTPPET